MQTLSSAQYESLVENGRPVKQMRQGVKVWRLDDGRILKLFRPRGRFSRSRLYPPNQRFARNAARLAQLGFTSVEVQQIFWNQANGCYGVIYPELPGRTLEELLTATDDHTVVLSALAKLIADLHRAGVNFRSLHLGNVLMIESGTLALIDVQELTFRRRPLGLRARAKNLTRLLRRPQDRALLGESPFEELFSRYLGCSDLSVAAGERLRRLLQNEIPETEGTH
jgi:hypothetical protein